MPDVASPLAMKHSVPAWMHRFRRTLSADGLAGVRSRRGEAAKPSYFPYWDHP
jgi:hypothetical protein